MKGLRQILVGLVALQLLIGSAFAQTSPNFTFGSVPTTAQWNFLFQNKQDYLGAPPVLTTGGTMTGPLVTAASIAAAAGFNLPPGTAPTAPNNGDLWTTTAGLFVRVNGSTVGPLGGGGGSVTSVFTRTGAVTAASGDYTIGQINGLGTGVGTSLAAAVSASGGITPFGGAATHSALTLSSITGSTQCLQVNSSGLVSGTTCGTNTLTVGSTTVSGGSANNVLTTGTGTLSNATIASLLAAGPGISITGTTTATIGIGGTNTAHGVPIWAGAANSLGNTGVGQTGQQLTGVTGADPTFQGGGWTLLATLTCPNNTAAFCDDTSHITTAYNEYAFVMTNLTPSSNATQGLLQVHASGAFQSSGYYGTALASAGVLVAGVTNSIPLTIGGVVGNSTGFGGLSGTVLMYGNPGSSNVHGINATVNYNVNTTTWGGGIADGAWINAAVIDGVRFAFASSNIASGTVKIYGRL